MIALAYCLDNVVGVHDSKTGKFTFSSTCAPFRHLVDSHHYGKKKTKQHYIFILI